MPAIEMHYSCQIVDLLLDRQAFVSTIFENPSFSISKRRKKLNVQYFEAGTLPQRSFG